MCVQYDYIEVSSLTFREQTIKTKAPTIMLLSIFSLAEEARKTGNSQVI